MVALRIAEVVQYSSGFKCGIYCNTTKKLCISERYQDSSWDKKCIMKPMDNQIGKTELWSATPPVTNLRNIYFKFQGINYYLIASSED